MGLNAFRVNTREVGDCLFRMRAGMAIAGSCPELDSSVNRFAFARTEVDEFSIMPYIT